MQEKAGRERTLFGKGIQKIAAVGKRIGAKFKREPLLEEKSTVKPATKLAAALIIAGALVAGCYGAKGVGEDCDCAPCDDDTAADTDVDVDSDADTDVDSDADTDTGSENCWEEIPDADVKMLEYGFDTYWGEFEFTGEIWADEETAEGYTSYGNPSEGNPGIVRYLFSTDGKTYGLPEEIGPELKDRMEAHEIILRFDDTYYIIAGMDSGSGEVELGKWDWYSTFHEGETDVYVSDDGYEVRLHSVYAQPLRANVMILPPEEPMEMFELLPGEMLEPGEVEGFNRYIQLHQAGCDNTNCEPQYVDQWAEIAIYDEVKTIADGVNEEGATVSMSWGTGIINGVEVGALDEIQISAPVEVCE
ncbi:MAG: hypothetical protein GY852_03970 [bacterium]|nr:hypothetical protein [bacterium]